MKEIFGVLEYLKVRYLSDEKGQGIVEYALILAFVVVVAAAITSSNELSTAVKGSFTNMTTAFGTAGGGAGGGAATGN